MSNRILTALVTLVLACLVSIAVIAVATQLEGMKDSDAEIRISGIGNGGITINYSGRAALARRFAKDPRVPLVSDADLAQLLDKLKTNAAAGDTESVLFLLELAAAQRPEKPAEAAQKPAP